MATQIRQEINILDSLLTAASGSSATSNEIIQLDTTKYNGATYYFEIVADSSVSLGFNVTLVGAIDGTLATISVPVLTTAYTLFRSTSFTVTTATQDCTVQIANTVGATKNVKSARIIIIQNAATLTNTETQVEVGNASTTTSVTQVPITNPKYWLYTSANWNGTITAYFEATFKSGTSKSVSTVELQVADGTGDGFTGWASMSPSALISTTSTTPVRVISNALTLTSGRNYRVVISTPSSKSAMTLYSAKIIIDQNYYRDQNSGPINFQRNINGGTSGSGQSNQAAGQSFTAGTSYTLTSIDLQLVKSGSPTDNLVLELLTTSITGTVIATSSNVAASGIGTNVWVNFPFSNTSISSGTKYYLRLSRTPDSFDSTNVIKWDTTSTAFANGGFYTRDNNTWSSESSTEDANFRINATVSNFTKLEPQYLLANTLFAAGTGLQTFLTKWDSTEWSGVTNTYTFQAEAANGSTSDVTLEQADGGGTVTNSTLTNIDNAQISSAMTMPGNENLDTKATTNAGDVAGARILVATVVSTTSDLSISVSDSTAVTDTPTILIPTNYINVSDSSTVSDTPTINLKSYVNVTDSSTVSDAITASLVSVFSVSDSTAIGESVALSGQDYVNVTDSTAVSDTITLYETTYFFSVSDTSAISDAITVSPTSYISVNDSSTVSDTVSVTVPLPFSVSDSTAIGDTVTIEEIDLINVTDSSAIGETTTVRTTLQGVVVSDSTAIGESVALSIQNYINVSDSTAVADAPTILLISSGAINVQDTTTVSDSVTITVSSPLISVTDSTAVSDTVALSPLSYINVADSTAVTDDATIVLASTTTQGYSFVVFID